MSRFIPGDYVRPEGFNSFLKGLGEGAVFRVRWTDGTHMELQPENEKAKRHNLRGVRLHASDFVKVVRCRGQWVDARESIFLHDSASFFDDADVMTERMAVSCASPQSMPEPDHSGAVGTSVEHADKLVERAAATLYAAKENARKAREEARAAAKAEAKRKAAAEAAKKAREEREAVAIRLHKDRDLAAATAALIAELSRLHNGGAEQDAPAIVAMHAEQLQPLAKSYGYKIAKPGVIAIVVKA